MGDSDDRIPVERDSVETMLTALKTMRGAFNPDLAFAERLDLGIERIEALLDSGGDPLSVKRENVETMLERVRNFRSNFNPDSAALKENTPGIAAFAERLESAADRLEDALK
jgi:methyl-accepting chemotaxis protein